MIHVNLIAEIRREDKRARNRAAKARAYAADGGVLRRRSVEWRKKNPLKAAAAYRKDKYGITDSVFHQMLIAQNGLCGICEVQLGSRLHVDHCHATEKVRGLLCQGCNIGLGGFQDNSRAMRAAAGYMQRGGCH